MLIELNARREREQAHERLIAAADAMYAATLRRLTPETLARLKALHVELGERINAVDPA